MWLLIGLATAVVAFAAISISVNALRPDVPTTSNSSAVDPRAQDSDYVLHLGSAALPDLPQEQAIALGRSTCRAIMSGQSKAQASAGLISQGLTSQQAAYVLAAALTAYCPEKR